MDPITISRSIAERPYAAVRQPLTVVEERVVASQWGEGASVRLGSERSLGWLDRFAGWLLADEQISQRGQALLQRTGHGVAEEKHATAGDAQARQAGERAEEQPDGPAGPAARAGTVDVRFTLPAQVQADTVTLCGEFNNWSAQDIQLKRADDRSWQATAALEPGWSYRYRYLLDGERWENVWQADRYVPNPYGSTDSVVVVGPYI